MSGIVGASNSMVVRPRVYDDKLSNSYGYSNGHITNGTGGSNRNPINQIARDGSEDVSGDDSTSFTGSLFGNFDNPTFVCADGNRRTITSFVRSVFSGSTASNNVTLIIAHDTVPANQSGGTGTLTVSEVATSISTAYGSLNFSDANIIRVNCPNSTWDDYNNACTKFTWNLSSGISDTNDPLNTPSDVLNQTDSSGSGQPFSDMRAYDNLIEVTITI